MLPPDASYSSAIYTPIRKPHQQSQQPAPAAAAAAVSPMAQVRNGPNGNFVIYERQSQDATYGTTSQQQQPQQPVYGRVASSNPLRYQYPRKEGMYSNPPPPLPYRPPPPNPYRQPANPHPESHQSPVRHQSPMSYRTPPSTKFQNGGSPFAAAKRNEVAAGRDQLAAYNSGKVT